MDEFGSPPPPKTGLLKRKVPRLVIHFKSQLNSDMSGFTRWTAHQNDMSGEICCLLKHSQQFVSLFCSLIQAHLGSLSVQDFALTQDTGKIFRSAVRISRCENENHSSVCSRQQSHLSDCKKKKKKKKLLFFVKGLLEVHWQRPCFKTLLNAVLLAKCCKTKLWENSKHVSRQLTGIGEPLSFLKSLLKFSSSLYKMLNIVLAVLGAMLSNALVNAGLITFQKIEDTNPREIELVRIFF